MPADVFEPDRRTVGQVLSNTTPAIRVPDYQRDFSWETKEVTDFWADIVDFDRRYPGDAITGRQYFLGAMVLVNNGQYHLLLDGQQRLATATILLAALRDKILEYNQKAADQLHDGFIAYQDHLSGGRTLKLQLNVFDRPFFNSCIQSFPRAVVPPTKRSHQLIKGAYDLLSGLVDDEWTNAGGGRDGFQRIGRISKTLTDHVAIITVVSTDETSAGAIFETLNDRGIGLSQADLLRSWLLQRAAEGTREEMIECWSEVFECCGTSERAQTLIRLSWVARRGDVKARKLHQVIQPTLEQEGVEPVVYSRQLRDDATFHQRLREGDSDDVEVGHVWRGIRTLRANAGYALLLAAKDALDEEAQSRLARALVTLVVRHNVVAKGDRAKFESVVFEAAKDITEGKGEVAALEMLQSLSPTDRQFEEGFAQLNFPRPSRGAAQYILREIERHLRVTQEVDVNPPNLVHLEHIYPLKPEDQNRWPNHKAYVDRIGNLTLLDGRLNVAIKNADFATKKAQAYAHSELRLTAELLEYDHWTSIEVDQRQGILCERAKEIWPRALVPAAVSA